MLELSVIIPCYNEEENLEETIRRIKLPSVSFEIIVVNDGSQDRTKEIAQKIKEEYENVKLLNLPRNQGKTIAVKEGISRAEGKIIIIHDADLTVAPEYVSIFYREIFSSPDTFLMGTRFKLKLDRKAMPLKNLLANEITAKIFSILLSCPITDTLCGTKAFPREMVKFINFSSCRWPDFDLIIAARKANLTIKEIPVHYSPRKAGVSKMKIYPDVWQLFIKLLKAVWELRN